MIGIITCSFTCKYANNSSVEFKDLIYSHIIPILFPSFLAPILTFVDVNLSLIELAAVFLVFLISSCVLVCITVGHYSKCFNLYT